MLNFSANLSLLFNELEMPDRIKAAKTHGFTAVEMQFPYDVAARTLQKMLKKHSMHLVLFNVDADDLLRGGEGLAAVPGKQKQFRDAVNQAIEYARILKPEAINILPGRCLNPEFREQYMATFLENLAFALDAFDALGINTVFEAINTHDMPGFLVHNGQQMLDILEQVAHPNLLLQFDIYHMYMMSENIEAFINRNAGEIGHIQFADAPGRAQPGTGRIDFAHIFSVIADSAYKGWVGAEYFPKGSTVDSLEWMHWKK